MKTLKRKTRSDKFPLTLHTTGQYCKKIKGKMVLRWTAGGFLTTEKHFQRIGGYKQLWMLKSYLHELEKEEIIAEKRKVG